MYDQMEAARPLLSTSPKALELHYGVEVDLRQGYWMLFDLSTTLTHILLDLIVVRNYYIWGHWQFGSLIMFFYTKHVLDYRNVYLKLSQHIETSLKQGYFTDDVIRLREGQRAQQGIPSLIVTAYALPWACNGIYSGLQQFCNLALAIYGIACLRVERDLRG